MGADSVALVGGSAACVATYVALVKQRATKTIYVIEPDDIGPGTVSGNSDQDLICNTSGEIMSVMANAPQDYLVYYR
jgi:uncharacterized NAD(P)/FAD-binding protein YdhS